MDTTLFTRKCINCLRKVLSPRLHPCLGTFCFVCFSIRRRMGVIDVHLILKGSINESVSHHQFKMDSPYTVTKLMNKNCFMASIDMKDAYYSTPISSLDRKCLRFISEGNLYEFTCFPKGLSCAPRFVTKLPRGPLSYPHRSLLFWAL